MELPRLTPHEHELVERTVAAARAYLADRQVPMPQAHDLAFTLVCSDDLLRCTVQLLVDLLGSAEIDPPPPGPMQ